ncbi:MAG TPA: EamA family transporter [Clostridiales bacterium]|nr:EamA family transporter [Clostridiales bacterium]
MEVNMNLIKSKYAAIICMLVSALSYSIMQFCVKLTPNIPIMEKILIRNLFSTIIAFIVIKKKKLSLFGNKKNQKFLFGRTLGGYLGMNLFFIGTMQVTLSSAAIINKLSPFVVMILAYFFLKEKITKYHIIALALALLGSWLVIKPQFNSSITPIVILLISAILSGIAFTSLRALGDKENEYTIIFHYSFISVAISIPFLFFNFVLTDLKSTLILLSVGIFAAVGQIALTYAYKLAPASEVSIYDYSNIIFSSLIGYFFLQEQLDWIEIVGIIIIISSSIIVYRANKKIE